MLKKLFTSIKGKPEDAAGRNPFRLPQGMRVYAVGDIHGRLDLLARMRDLIAEDHARTKPDTALIVFLGDYVDRGPNSKGVVEALARETFPAPILTLLGNHEAMLLDFLDRPAVGDLWRKFGGIETIHSYGIDVVDFRTGQNLEAVSAALREAIPRHHLDFLYKLPLSHAVGEYFFCHAGVRPGVALDQQSEEDLLWIRDEFITSEIPFGAIVVHGHTPGERPFVRANGIGIDTGAYITGKLTCAALAPSGVTFLST